LKSQATLKSDSSAALDSSTRSGVVLLCRYVEGQVASEFLDVVAFLIDVNSPAKFGGYLYLYASINLGALPCMN